SIPRSRRWWVGWRRRAGQAGRRWRRRPRTLRVVSWLALLRLWIVDGGRNRDDFPAPAALPGEHIRVAVIVLVVWCLLARRQDLASRQAGVAGACGVHALGHGHGALGPDRRHPREADGPGERLGGHAGHMQGLGEASPDPRRGDVTAPALVAVPGVVGVQDREHAVLGRHHGGLLAGAARHPRRHQDVGAPAEWRPDQSQRAGRGRRGGRAGGRRVVARGVEGLRRGCAARHGEHARSDEEGTPEPPPHMAVSESWLPHDGDTLAITVKPEGAIYQVGITPVRRRSVGRSGQPGIGPQVAVGQALPLAATAVTQVPIVLPFTVTAEPMVEYQSPNRAFPSTLPWCSQVEESLRGCEVFPAASLDAG